ncbi:MAG: hypothetical protein U0793_28975 [Gemmataceae bacterium]
MSLAPFEKPEADAVPNDPNEAIELQMSRVALAPAQHAGRPRRSAWILASLVFGLLAFALGVRIASSPVVPRKVVPAKPEAPAAGVRLEELKSEQELFALAGQEALVLKYSGGDIQFWIEIESRGEKRTIGPVEAPRGAADEGKFPATRGAEVGHFLFVHGEADETGKEIWRLACRRRPVAPSRDDHKSSFGLTTQVKVWSGERPATIDTLATSLFLSPLPPDRDVCLKTIQVTGRRPPTWTGLSATAIGGFVAPLWQGPLEIAAALAHESLEPTVEAYTVRVMCRAR